MNPELCRQALAKVVNPNVLVNLVSRRVRQLNSGGGGSNRTPTWTNPTTGQCGTCHGFPPPVSAGHPAIDPALLAGFPATPIGGTCSCHGNVNQQTAVPTTYQNVFIDPALHINGILEGGKCDACHGYPPASPGFVGTMSNWSGAKTENYPHMIESHVRKTARPSDGFAYCNKCHNAADHRTSVALDPANIRITVNPRVRMESAKQVKYSSNRLGGASHVTGTCSNISCHFGATPKWDPSH